MLIGSVVYVLPQDRQSIQTGNSFVGTYGLNSHYQYEFSEGRNEYEDMSLMASCGNHIISNSTLAWWAAWLGHNPDKTVVCPHHLNWFGPANPHREHTFDLFPPTWNEIKFR